MILNQSSRNLPKQASSYSLGQKSRRAVSCRDGWLDYCNLSDFRATINNTDTGTEFDDVWLANLPQMPPLDLPVTICLQLPDLE